MLLVLLDWRKRKQAFLSTWWSFLPNLTAAVSNLLLSWENILPMPLSLLSFLLLPYSGLPGKIYSTNWRQILRRPDQKLRPRSPVHHLWSSLLLGRAEITLNDRPCCRSRTGRCGWKDLCCRTCTSRPFHFPYDSIAPCPTGSQVTYDFLLHLSKAVLNPEIIGSVVTKKSRTALYWKWPFFSTKCKLQSQLSTSCLINKRLIFFFTRMSWFLYLVSPWLYFREDNSYMLVEVR